MATTGFGDRMYGNFAVVGGAPADVDDDGDPTTWELAWIVIPDARVLGRTLYIDMNFSVTGTLGGEAIVGQIPFIPEPAMLSLLALGGIGVLRKRQ